jgi:hypothetical protein
MANEAAPAVGANTTIVRVTPTINTDAYASGDALGGLLTFTNALLAKDIGVSTGVIVSAFILDEENSPEHAPIELWLFKATFTATANNAPFDVSDADLLNCLGVIKFAASDYVDSANCAIATRTNVGLVVEGSAVGETSLFGQMVVRATPTYALLDVTVGIGIAQD